MQRLPTAHGVFGLNLASGNCLTAPILGRNLFKDPRTCAAESNIPNSRYPLEARTCVCQSLFKDAPAQSVRKPPSSAMVTLIKRPKKANSRVD